MRPQAIWFTTAGLSTIALCAVGPVWGSATQLWNPNVTHAAKVTANLLQNKSLHPVLFSRSKSSTRSSQLFIVKGVRSSPLMHYSLPPRLALVYPSLSIDRASRTLLTSPKSNQTLVTESQAATLHNLGLELKAVEFHAWYDSLDPALSHPNAQDTKSAN